MMTMSESELDSRFFACGGSNGGVTLYETDRRMGTLVLCTDKCEKKGTCLLAVQMMCNDTKWAGAMASYLAPKADTQHGQFLISESNQPFTFVLTNLHREAKLQVLLYKCKPNGEVISQVPVNEENYLNPLQSIVVSADQATQKEMIAGINASGTTFAGDAKQFTASNAVAFEGVYWTVRVGMLDSISATIVSAFDDPKETYWRTVADYLPLENAPGRHSAGGGGGSWDMSESVSRDGYGSTPAWMRTQRAKPVARGGGSGSGSGISSAVAAHLAEMKEIARSSMQRQSASSFDGGAASSFSFGSGATAAAAAALEPSFSFDSNRGIVSSAVTMNVTSGKHVNQSFRTVSAELKSIAIRPLVFTLSYHPRMVKVSRPNAPNAERIAMWYDAFANNVMHTVDSELVYPSDTCVICSDPNPECTLLPCRHKCAHIKCIQDPRMGNSVKCPYCRVPVRAYQIDIPTQRVVLSNEQKDVKKKTVALHMDYNDMKGRDSQMKRELEKEKEKVATLTSQYEGIKRVLIEVTGRFRAIHVPVRDAPAKCDKGHTMVLEYAYESCVPTSYPTNSYTCDKCKRIMKVLVNGPGYHCRQCVAYDLCPKCAEESC